MSLSEGGSEGGNLWFIEVLTHLKRLLIIDDMGICENVKMYKRKNIHKQNLCV